MESTSKSDKKYLRKACFFKKKFIDFYLRNHTPDLIVNEVMYGISQKISDLIIIDNNDLISVEIKSDADNLNRIAAQIEESRKNFDYVIVFASQCHVSKLFKMLPPEIGLYTMCENGYIKLYSRPHRLRQNEIEAAYSIPLYYLKKFFPMRVLQNSDDYRREIANNKAADIINLRKIYLKEKYQGRYNLFLTERGISTHEEDLQILSMGEIVEF